MHGRKRRGVLLDDNDPALFPKLTDEQMDLLARHGKVRATQSGEVLFREGDATYDVMVVLEGSVVVIAGKGDSERELAIQRPRTLGARVTLIRALYEWRVTRSELRRARRGRCTIWRLHVEMNQNCANFCRGAGPVCMSSR